MNERRARAAILWPISLWLALLAGITTAWSPRYWKVSIPVVSVSALAAASTGRSLIRGFRDIALPWQVALVIAIGCWGFMQIAVGISVLPQLTLYASVVWAIDAIAFVIAAEILARRQMREIFLQTMMWSITALGTIAMVQSFEHAEVFGLFAAPDTVFGTYASRNEFAALMELGAPLALWFMVERNFLLGGMCYAMIAASVLASASRAGFTLVGVELLVFLAIVSVEHRRQAKTLIATFAGLALLIGMAAAIAGTDRITQRFHDENPYQVRRQLLESTEKLIRERPFTGFGMGTWMSVYPRAATFDAALLANEAHNDWAQWTAEGGAGFTLLIAILVLSVLAPAVRSIWGLGLLSVMAHSYVDFPLRDASLSLLWFVLAAAAAVATPGRSGRRIRRTSMNEEPREAIQAR